MKSLFTNISVIETCKIILDTFFPEFDSMYLGFNKTQFRNILNKCTQNNLFLSNGSKYLLRGMYIRGDVYTGDVYGSK